MHGTFDIQPVLGVGDADGQGLESYDYVPGAGDDEECWARGLTPVLLRQHREVHTHTSPALVQECDQQPMRNGIRPDLMKGASCDLHLSCLLLALTMPMKVCS